VSPLLNDIWYWCWVIHVIKSNLLTLNFHIMRTSKNNNVETLNYYFCVWDAWQRAVFKYGINFIIILLKLQNEQELQYSRDCTSQCIKKSVPIFHQPSQFGRLVLNELPSSLAEPHLYSKRNYGKTQIWIINSVPIKKSSW